MKHKLFLNTFIVSIVVFISCFTVTVGALYGYFSDRHITELKNRALLIASALNQYGDDFLDLMELDTNVRVTLISADGTVLQDTVSDSSVLENHADHEEIREALEYGYGQSSRYSNTLSARFDYCAILLNNGQILRLSDTQYTPLTLIGNIVYPIAAILAMAVLLSFLLAARVSKGITAPINNIDLTNPDENKIYLELRPLTERINAQNRQIDWQMEQLKLEHERQDKLRREFTANVSHELKTPLTSISGYAEIIQNGMVEPKDISVFAGRILGESKRLITLVEDIIKLSQLEEKEITLPTSEIDLYSASADILSHLHATAEKQHISLKLEGEHCRITGARQLIDEMIYNLCDNSIKYNNPGGSVTVSVSRSGDNILLTVSDTGIGIPEEGISRVFERFYRMDKSHSKSVGGTGLGLSIVKHGAAYHNAEIICNSMVGVGTTISIVFPTDQPQL